MDRDPRRRGRLGGVSGAFLASYLGTVDPGQFSFSFSIFILAMVVLGGLGSVRGVIAGAIVLSAFDTWLLPDVLYDLPGAVGLDFDLSQIASGVYGLLLVVVMLVRPAGLLPDRAGGAERRVSHSYDIPRSTALSSRSFSYLLRRN
jgi:branched-chain amino acid transport system permease protein